MKKLAFLILCMSILLVSCNNDSYYEPFIVTGIESIPNSNMSNYYEKGQDKQTMENYVLAPTGKYQIGDTIPEASIRFK